MPEKNPEAYSELFNLLTQRQPPNERVRSFDEVEANLPPYPVSPFAPDPPLLGGPPELAKLFQTLMSRAPNLKKLISKVTFGPSEDYTQRMVANEMAGGTNFPAHRFPETNLLGLSNTKTGNVTLNPRLAKDPEEMSGILVHELAHIGSQDQNERTAQKAADLYFQSQGKETFNEKAVRKSQESDAALKKLFEELSKLGFKATKEP